MDRNLPAYRHRRRVAGRSPCGSVDRNTLSVVVVEPPVVAPRAGAWIETSVSCVMDGPPNVAPRAGAWIETGNLAQFSNVSGSLPVRERGSKLVGAGGQMDDLGSLPVRERGSKLYRQQRRSGIPQSLPVRERGSKRSYPRWIDHCRCRSPCGSVDRNTRRFRQIFRLLVAPRAGAWIETPCLVTSDPCQPTSLPVRERGSKRILFQAR